MTGSPPVPSNACRQAEWTSMFRSSLPVAATTCAARSIRASRNVSGWPVTMQSQNAGRRRSGKTSAVCCPFDPDDRAEPAGARNPCNLGLPIAPKPTTTMGVRSFDPRFFRWLACETKQVPVITYADTAGAIKRAISNWPRHRLECGVVLENEELQSLKESVAEPGGWVGPAVSPVAEEQGHDESCESDGDGGGALGTPPFGH